MSHDKITESLRDLQEAVVNPSGKWGVFQERSLSTSMTMIPTCSFRWLVPNFAAYAEQPTCGRLQQLFHTSLGEQWIDVRIVEEFPSAKAETP